MTSPNLRCRVAAMLARIACSTAFTTHGRWKVQRQPPSQVLQGGHGGGGWRQAAAGGRGLPGGCCPPPLFKIIPANILNQPSQPLTPDSAPQSLR